MILKTMIVGAFGVNCYILGCKRTKTGAVIDPGGDAGEIWAMARELGLDIKLIINTHGHVDHIAGNAELKSLSGADIVIGEADGPMLTNPARNLSFLTPVTMRSVPADRTVSDGDVIEIGDLKLEVLATPGHTPGGITLVTDKIAFTGDTLFAGSIGRTDFPGGSFEQIISSIKNRILPLGDDVRVLPGHGPASTVGVERSTNPFIT